MRHPPVTITLGDRSWSIRPLTLRQIQALEPIVVGAVGGITYNIEIIGVALSRDFPGDIEGLLDVEASAIETREAAAAILRIAGYLPAEDVPLGEAEAPKGAE